MLGKILCLSIAFSVLFLSPAYAYLDPATGSLIMQVLAAGLIGAAAFWKSIVSFFRKPPKDSPDGHEQ